MSPRELDPSKHEAILDAAIRIFSEKGFTATRIVDIAEAAGIGKGTVYEYVTSKEQLMADACIRMCEVNEQAMRELGAQTTPEQGNTELHPVKASYLTLKAVIEVLLSRPQQELRLIGDLINLSQVDPSLMTSFQEHIKGKYLGWRGTAKALTDHGVEQGFFRNVGPSVDEAELIVAAVDGLVVQSMVKALPDTSTVAQRIARAWVRLNMIHPDKFEEYIA